MVRIIGVYQHWKKKKKLCCQIL